MGSRASACCCRSSSPATSSARSRRSRSRRSKPTGSQARGRVHAELLRLARLGDGKTIAPAPVLSVLAVRVHSTRETVSRTIGALERRGLVKRDGKALVITAPHRLEELG